MADCSEHTGIAEADNERRGGAKGERTGEKREERKNDGNFQGEDLKAIIARINRIFPPVGEASEAEAIAIGSKFLSYKNLAEAACNVAKRLAVLRSCQAGRPRPIAVWASPCLETCAAIAGVLAAGALLLPINPKIGVRELEHILTDSEFRTILAPPNALLPDVSLLKTKSADSITILTVELYEIAAGTDKSGRKPFKSLSETTTTERWLNRTCGTESNNRKEATGILLYTSGTAGAPKGVHVGVDAIASNLDALARVWKWTAEDVVVHSLPLFHVHGLVLGLLGPLRFGTPLRIPSSTHFDPAAIIAELNPKASDSDSDIDSGLGSFGTDVERRPGTMLFGVPTMYQRLCAFVERNKKAAQTLKKTRLLICGSAPLPPSCRARFLQATGQTVLERYGMTETLIICSQRFEAVNCRIESNVGRPLNGVELRLVDDTGAVIEPGEESEENSEKGGEIGEIEVRGPSLFYGYLNRPEATAAAFHEGWFRTGDMATRALDGSIRIVGRRATDIIKTGGFKVGASEVENALLEHASVREAAVAGRPDSDLGERLVAWVVRSNPPLTTSVDSESDLSKELIAHVSTLLAPHKRPREIRFVAALPRNELGKVLKRALP